jgi:hypothetical protein
VSKRASDAVFQAMFILTDLRVMLRETAPTHEFDPEQKASAAKLLVQLEKQVVILREELLR